MLLFAIELLVAVCSATQWAQRGGDVLPLTAHERSGYDVEISSDGMRLVVGAPNYDGQRGLARVYDFNGTSWTLSGELAGPHPRSEYGTCVALSPNGMRVAVGAFAYDTYKMAPEFVYSYDSPSPNLGMVQVFEYGTGVGWQQLGGDLIGNVPDAYFGQGLALSGDGGRIAIGATGAACDAVNHGQCHGEVRVFEYSSSTGWTQLGSAIEGVTLDTSKSWGEAVSLSTDGLRLAASARNYGGFVTGGHVRVFEYDTDAGDWVQMGGAIEGGGRGYFGMALQLSGDGLTFIAGATINSEHGSNTGLARVYRYSGSTGSWQQLGDDLLGKKTVMHKYGEAVALSADGNRVAVSSVRDDGYVHVFELSEDGTSWALMGGGDLTGGADASDFGHSIALSADGFHIAVGDDNVAYPLQQLWSAGKVQVFHWPYPSPPPASPPMVPSPANPPLAPDNAELHELVKTLSAQIDSLEDLLTRQVGCLNVTEVEGGPAGVCRLQPAAGGAFIDLSIRAPPP